MRKYHYSSSAVFKVARRELIPHRALHRSIVTVYVGPEKYPFYFHKGRLCQHSSFFEKAFHGSFQEATTGSMYLGEDGIDEFKLFEEWLYTKKFSYPKDSDDPSLLLMKVFCFADKIRNSALQNATLDAIRDRAEEQRISSLTRNTPQGLFVSAQRSPFGWSTEYAGMANPSLGKSVAKTPPPATVSAVQYAYQRTPEHSPLRKLLSDIFAYNVEPGMLNENILSFPIEFLADVLLTNMKRLPFRLDEEAAADFDENADKYHIHDSLDTPDNRDEKTSEDVEARGTASSSKKKKKRKGLI